MISSLGAQPVNNNFKDREKKYVDEARFKRYQGALLEDEALIPGKNYDLGIIESNYYTEKDSFRINVMALFNPNFRKITSVRSLEIMAGKNLDWFWLEGFFSSTSADFSEIMSNRTSADATVPNSEANFFRSEETSEDLVTLGVGMGHRFRWFQRVLGARDVFEHVASYLTYHSLTEAGRNLTYKGPGFRSDFGLHKRISPTFHVGVNLSYNLGIVEREKLIETENRRDRTFVLSWISFGGDLAFYF